MADATSPAPAATPQEVAAFRSEQEKEWGTYVAVTDITFNGARAYNAGDPVPASNVALHGYAEQGLVAKVGTKSGDAAIGEAIAAVVAEPVAAPGAVSLNVTVPK